MPINIVLQDGVVKNPALRYGPDGKPEYRFTLVQQEHSPDGQKNWPLYLPCCAIGHAAERLAGELEEDMPIVVTSGKLCYRKRETKLGEQSRMEILVWTAQRLEPALAGVPAGEQSAADVASSDEPARPPEPKPRKPRYPKWRPEPSNTN